MAKFNKMICVIEGPQCLLDGTADIKARNKEEFLSDTQYNRTNFVDEFATSKKGQLRLTHSRFSRLHNEWNHIHWLGPQVLLDQLGLNLTIVN